jgi:hypothetical protein
VFKEEVALTTVLNNLFQQDVVMNIEVNEWDKMVSWTLKRANLETPFLVNCIFFAFVK